MPASTLRKEILKWAVAILLGLMLLGGVAMVYWAPVHGYDVSCTKAQRISCVVERESAAGRQRWNVPLGTEAVATVQIQPRLRSSDRVFLYLGSPTQDIFAAEFEGGAAVDDAKAAADRLNRVFSSPGPASAHVSARPPSYLRWLSWGGLGFLGLFVFIIYRELFKPERQPLDSREPTRLRGAA